MAKADDKFTRLPKRPVVSGAGSGILPSLQGDGRGAVFVHGVGAGVIAGRPAPYKPGKQWVLETVGQRREELLATGSVTAAARALSKRSETRADGPPLSSKYCENILREIGLFAKKRRR
jgi:hypothetical protein